MKEGCTAEEAGKKVNLLAIRNSLEEKFICSIPYSTLDAGEGMY